MLFGLGKPQGDEQVRELERRLIAVQQSMGLAIGRLHALRSKRMWGAQKPEIENAVLEEIIHLLERAVARATL